MSVSELDAPVCCCHKPGDLIKIDGVLYEYRGGMVNSGCRVHHPIASRYIPQPAELSRDKKVDSKRNTTAVKGGKE